MGVALESQDSVLLQIFMDVTIDMENKEARTIELVAVQPGRTNDFWYVVECCFRNCVCWCKTSRTCEWGCGNPKTKALFG